MFTYTVAVRPRFLPFWTKYEVVGHKLNTDIPGHPRLALSFVDGSAIIIPKFEFMYFKIFPDKLARDEMAGRLQKSQQQAAIQEGPTYAELPE